MAEHARRRPAAWRSPRGEAPQEGILADRPIDENWMASLRDEWQSGDDDPGRQPPWSELEEAMTEQRTAIEALVERVATLEGAVVELAGRLAELPSPAPPPEPPPAVPRAPTTREVLLALREQATGTASRLAGEVARRRARPR